MVAAGSRSKGWLSLHPETIQGTGWHFAPDSSLDTSTRKQQVLQKTYMSETMWLITDLEFNII
jgi:hypothetical protein